MEELAVAEAQKRLAEAKRTEAEARLADAKALIKRMKAAEIAGRIDSQLKKDTNW